MNLEQPNFVEVNQFLTLTEQGDVPARLTILYPNDPGIIFETTTDYAITWLSTNTVGKFVKLELYKGDVLKRMIAENIKNDRSHNWTVPPNLETGSDYKIKISSSADSSIYDFSDNYFIIQQISRLLIAHPDSAGIVWNTGKRNTIFWYSFGDVGPYVLIELYRNDVFDKIINYSADNSGTYTWTVPEDQTPDSNYTIKITSTALSTVFDFSDNPFTISSDTDVEENNFVILSNQLYPNYPNPFNPATTVRYELKNSSHVKICVFNIRGEMVKSLVNTFQSPGTYQLLWDGTDDKQNFISSGIFFIEMKAGEFTQKRKITLLR